MRNYLLILTAFFILIFFVSCSPSKKTKAIVADIPTKASEAIENKEDVFFTGLFKQQPGLMDSVLLHRKDWNVQII